MGLCADIKGRFDPDRAAVAERLEQWLTARSWAELAWVVEHRPQVALATASGDRYVVRLRGYWDMDPWLSDLCVSGKVHRVRRGRRTRGSHRVETTLWGEELPEHHPDLTDPGLAAWAATV